MMASRFPRGGTCRPELSIVTGFTENATVVTRSILAMIALLPKIDLMFFGDIRESHVEEVVV